ncbi:Armadillo-type fold [Phytophthora cinnamomi]|uniref:Armadillo-type fold n=1 Tax=Phytophthora cinnamomi TaxID=4785 RepID=UPI003559BCE3|nr:Armadillo-type fold [Phytophthora cinnamomi]
MSRRYLTPASASQLILASSDDSSWESFQKLFASAADPQTQNNHARHLALTKNILYENELGWKIAELPLVSELLKLLATKVLDGVPQFAEQLVLAVVRCFKPFIRQKSNEEITNPSLLHEILPTLGELLSFDDIEVQVAAAEALRVFATGACLPRVAPKTRSNNAEGKSDDLRLTPRIFSQNLMEETGAVDAIVAVMHDLFPDDDLREEEQEPQLIESVPDFTYDFENTEDQPPTQNQEEESTTNEEAQAEETVVEATPQDNEIPQPAKKPVSAPPYGRKGSFSRDENIIVDTKEDTNEDNTAAHHSQISVRSTKPASAPSAIHRGSKSVDGVNMGSDSQHRDDTPEHGNDATSRPGSASMYAQEDQQLSENDGRVEDELVRVTGNALPIHMRLSMLLFPLIDLLYELSAYQRCAEVLVVSGALHYIVFILENITNPQDELLPLCLEILWNVLELSHEKISAVTKCASRKELLEVFRLRNATFFLGNEFTFQALLHVLELLLAHGYRQQDKEMRNECVMILQLLAKRRRSMDFFYSTGLTACLFSYATSAELSHAKGSGTLQGRSQQDKSSATASAITASNQYYATNSDVDFEFKQMLWFLLAEISCDHQANLSELVQFRFIEVWLSYATANNVQQDQGAPPRASAHKYSSPQLQLLEWTALSVLNHVAPFVVDHFYEIGGHDKLLEFLQLNMGTEDVLASAWLLLLQIAPPQPFFQSELGKLSAIETAMDIFEAPPSRHTFAIRRNAILACASMCRNDDGSNRKRFRLANGVHALVQHLEFDPSHSVLEENILVGIIDAVRSCVIGDLESETAFINENGVPKLLSILGPAPKALKHQALAALAEICVNPAAIPSYQMWRCDQPGDNNNASANEVLLRIYAHEEAAEKRANQDSDDNHINSAAQSASDLVASTNVRHSAFLSVTTCRSPFIITPENSGPSDAPPSPTSRPESPAFSRLKDALKAGQGLASDKQSTRSVLQLEDHQLHPEVNLKAKIYSVLANVSFACEAESLTPQDQVMLEIAKEYPTFKLGEMWQNVERALHAEGVRPIYADALYIRKNIEHAYNISVCTKLAQQEVFTRSRQQNTEREDAFFEQILRQKHQEAQAEEFHRANRRQNSTMQLHLDAKRTRLEFMRRQDPAAFAAYESEERCLIRDPPPEYVDEQESYRTLQQNEAELRGRLSTITRSRKHTV